MNKEKMAENVWQKSSKVLFFAFVAILVAVAIGAGSAIAKQIETTNSEAQLQGKVETNTMYRLYNKWTGEHFYTADEQEKNNTVKAGWNDEGIGWYAPTDTSLTPVYRLYNKYVEGGDHHYTMNKDERDNLIKVGWSDEGICWYSCDTSDEQASPLYRQYNPNEQTGTHNYTLSEGEAKKVVAAGWRDEGTAWYGYKVEDPYPDDKDDDPVDEKTEIDFTKAEITLTGITYNGTQIKPAVKISGLTEGTDFVVTYGANKNAGKNAGSVTVTGKGNYTGTKTYNFDISQASIEDANIALGEDLTYNTKEQTQTVTKVWNTNFELSASDYTVSGNKQTEAGTYTLTVTGKGNFTGTAEASYVIEQLDISSAVITLGDDLTYTGEPQQQSVTSVVADGVTLLATDYDVAGDTQTNAGNYDLTITGKGSCTGTRTKTFQIERADLSDAEVVIDPTDSLYSGKEITPNVTVTFDGETLALDAEYTLSGDLAKTSAGTYEITATGVGNYQNTAKASWRINSIGEFWLNVANADNPDSGALKTQTEIAEEMRVLHGELDKTLGGKDKSALETEYTNYMNGKSADGTEDKEVRLYTKWNGTDAGSGANRWVEFRIIQVGEHDSDGSAVTFMATHSLPTAKAMNDNATNTGSWAGSAMCGYMSASKYVGQGLSSLASSAKTISKATKKDNYGIPGWSDGTTEDQFWLLSHMEVFSSSSNCIFTLKAFGNNEGAQYAWFKAQGVNAQTQTADTNKVIRDLDKTRDGSSPTGATSTYWWQRSPYLLNNSNFGYVDNMGWPGFNLSASTLLGVVPCFAF